MKRATLAFDEHEAIHELKHFLPAQAPLKDFIHHNTLHAFQNLKFHQAIYSASEIMGYRVSLSLAEYRSMYETSRIREDIIERVIAQRKGEASVKEWKEKALFKKFDRPPSPRIGSLRANWKRQYQIDLDSLVHPLLFRILCSYLDQGISMWSFPVWNQGLLASLRELERNSFASFFKTSRARKVLLNGSADIASLLKILVGDETLYKQYLYDQQFAHQGWSGMVSTVEDQPQTLLDHKKITIRELVIFELLMEIDALDLHFGENWAPLSSRLTERPVELFAELSESELNEITSIWQEAFEWSYYDEVLEGILINNKKVKMKPPQKTFQAMFCIDDRECSFRRYLEKFDPACETFGTPGFFGVEFFFKPEFGKFYSKLSPQPVTPKYLIKEHGTTRKCETDINFSMNTHLLFIG